MEISYIIFAVFAFLFLIWGYFKIIFGGCDFFIDEMDTNIGDEYITMRHNNINKQFLYKENEYDKSDLIPIDEQE